MNEIVTTVVGRITNHPLRKQLGTGREVVTFRMACNHRYFDRAAGEWREASTSYLTVDCWRRNLGRNIMASVVRGNPVIVHGRLVVREYEQDGRARTAVTLVADAVGPDLNHAMAALTPVRHNTDLDGAETAGDGGDTAPNGPGGAGGEDPTEAARQPGGLGVRVGAGPSDGALEAADLASLADAEPVEDAETGAWTPDEPSWLGEGDEAAVAGSGASGR